MVVGFLALPHGLGHVEERVLLEADVDEGRLHPGKDALDAALVDVPGNAALTLSLDVELTEKPVFDEGDPGLRSIGVDHQEALAHRGQWRVEGYEKLRVAGAHAD